MRLTPEFSETGRIEKLQYTLQLGALTGNHVPLVEKLQKDESIKSLHDLAKLDTGAWMERIKTTGFPPDIAGKDDEEKTKNYAGILTRIVEDAFPTAVIARHIEKDDVPDKEDLVTFFSNNPDFEFRDQQVETYIKNNTDALREVRNKDALIEGLKGRERLFKLTPRYQEMKPLMADGIDSAHRITSMGQSAFMMKYGDKMEGGAEKAAEIYAKAEHASAMALTLLTAYGEAFNATEPRVTKIHSELRAEFEHNPTWETLFGSISFCECEHCRSVYSPAAYLVDIIHKMPDSARDVLLKRRPDIGNIELTCENTNTPMPYVDLVNEVLENAVSPFTPFTIASTLGTDLDSGTLSQGLKDAFANGGITLSQNAAISVTAKDSQTSKGIQWLITDNGQEYKISRQLGGLSVSLNTQTRGTAEELSANPEHVNPAAYDELMKKVCPWNLPLNLWAEEARTYLEHLGVPRYELMETFQKQGTSSNPTNFAIASEYLGLTMFERQIITGGFEVKAVTIGNVILSGSQTIDGVVLAQGDFVLVKDQNVASENGIYVVKDTDWVRSDNADAETRLLKSMLVSVREGSQYKGSYWLLTAIPGGTIWIVQSREWDFWDLSDTPLVPLNEADWFMRFAPVPAFLERSGLSFNELLELLKTKFINPDGIIKLEPESTCKIEEISLTNLSNDAMGKIRCFVRLWRKLGWTMRELDKAITALNPADLNDDFLRQLSHIQQLHADLKTSVVKALSWYAPIDTTQYDDQESPKPKSLYEELFQNPAVIKLNPDETDLFKLNPARTELEIVGSLNDKKAIAALLGALRISESDLSLLIDGSEAVAAVITSDKKPNLENLSRLYRNVSLAQVLKLKVQDFLRVKDLTGINPFVNDSNPVTPANTKDTLKFVEVVKKIRASGFTIAELDYLLRHHIVTPSGIAPTEESIALVLDEIRSGLQKIAAENTFTPETSDPTGELTRSKLAIVLPFDQVDPAMALIDGTSTKADADKEAFIDTYFPMFLDAADAKTKLVGSTALTDKEARFAYVLAPLMAYLRRSLSESFVKQKLGDALQLETAAVELLLFKLVKSANDPTKMSIFLQQVFIESEKKLTAVEFSPQFQAFILLKKIATLIAVLKMRTEELGWILEHGASLDWLDFNTLPTDPTQSPASFTAWERLVDLFSLMDKLPSLRNKLSSDEWQELLAPFGMPPDTALPSEPALLATFDLAAKFNVITGNAVEAETQTLQILSERTGWKEEDLQFLAGAQGFGFTFPDAYKDERALKRLRACFAIMKRLGVSAEQCGDWAKADLTDDDACSIKQAVKAKYDNDQWLNIAKPLRDVLREKQRFALVSYLVAHPDPAKGQTWKDSNGLFDHFLIDVEMSPCMMTSRIKQAIGSVQLFIQRYLMNLEEGAIISLGQLEEWRKHWKWMKNYRVWEANRKVFFYPENWIEPELRDNKTPFFKDLENELLQNEVTMDTAETAFLNYLEKLDAVARLEIVGMYHQEAQDTKDKDILHVFGRTMGTPHIYYYRQQVRFQQDAPSYWTPWEKVDLDIEGNHLIPVVWNRRLHLFWPIFTEKAHPPTEPEKKAGADPRKYLEIQIAWSEYKNKKWSAKKVSRESLKSFFFPRQSEVLFSSLVINNNLVLRCVLPYSVPIINTDEQLDFILDLLKNHFLHQVGEFHFTGCNGKLLLVDFQYTANWYLTPNRTGRNYDSMMLIEDNTTDEDSLYLTTGHFPPSPNYDELINKKDDILTLGLTPDHFRLLVPHQDEYFASQRPFFYQDNTKTFFVIPRDVEILRWHIASEISPARIDRIHEEYYVPRIPIRDRLGPVINPGRFLVPEFPSPEEALVTRPETTSTLGMTTALSPTLDAGTIISTRSSPVGLRPMTLMSLTVPRPLDVVDHTYRPRKRYLFEIFYHPYVCLFIRELNRYGIDGLLKREIQFHSNDFFETAYDPHVKPVELVDQPYPLEDVDFKNSGVYSLYNWELFFHVPLLIADRLGKNQRFEEAQKWFHYIFDPTDTSSNDPAKHFWKVHPFIENQDVKKRIDELLKLLDPKSNNPQKQEIINQVNQWRDNPFNPHVIARLRITAYQKTVVMKYESYPKFGGRKSRCRGNRAASPCRILYAHTFFGSLNASTSLVTNSTTLFPIV